MMTLWLGVRAAQWRETGRGRISGREHLADDKDCREQENATPNAHVAAKCDNAVGLESHEPAGENTV